MNIFYHRNIIDFFILEFNKINKYVNDLEEKNICIYNDKSKYMLLSGMNYLYNMWVY